MDMQLKHVAHACVCPRDSLEGPFPKEIGTGMKPGQASAFAQAEPLQRRVLASQEASLGPMHNATLHDMVWVAGCRIWG